MRGLSRATGVPRRRQIHPMNSITIKNCSKKVYCQLGSNREHCKPMRYSAQIRVARALLNWSQSELARRAGVGLATLQRIEQGEGIVKGNFSTILKLQEALEKAGVQFSEDAVRGIGVEL